ncbi:ATP-binding protein [Sinomonas sp.]|uniref:ATP-binding protein n=1 Tax=Sinomonas sp. TaxID=1914986 RepID=UPI002FE0BAE4
MAATERFPHHLLAQSPADRLGYFAAKVVAHPRLKQTHLALLHTIDTPAGASLILVVGPTGVGKTTLRLRLEQQLLAGALPEMERDPGHLPVVALEAAAPDSGQFNWKDYYTRALLALEEPLIKDKIDHALRGTGRVRIERSTSTPDLRRALEQCLRQRRVAVVIVDEAQHLRRLTSGRRLLDQMDTLKSLAALSGAVHVLVGTYELLGLADLSAQLSRRSVVLHFGRYHAETPEDLLAFKSVLLTFQRHLPLATEPDLLGRWEEFYERSAGCVGVLKTWLQQALAAALEAGAATLTWQHLERSAPATRTLLSMVRESTEGEAALGQRGRERGELRLLLGLETERSAAPATTSKGGDGAQVTTRRPTGRAAQRRPTRDPVGAGRAEHER